MRFGSMGRRRGGELSQHMGVTFPTVAKAVGTLIDARLLEEFDDVVSGPGRPGEAVAAFQRAGSSRRPHGRREVM